MFKWHIYKCDIFHGHLCLPSVFSSAARTGTQSAYLLGETQGGQNGQDGKDKDQAVACFLSVWIGFSFKFRYQVYKPQESWMFGEHPFILVLVFWILHYYRYCSSMVRIGSLISVFNFGLIGPRVCQGKFSIYNVHGSATTWGKPTDDLIESYRYVLSAPRRLLTLWKTGKLPMIFPSEHDDFQ